MRLIDADELYGKTAEWEAQALHMVEITTNDEDKTEWRKWSAILGERSAFKFDIADAPTVDAIPVMFIKGELKHLRANCIDADPDDVDYAWDLKMKIEALSDLLGAWEDTYETD